MRPEDIVQHHVLFHAPMGAADWVDRVEGACLALEAAFPGERLRKANLPNDASGEPRELADRRAFLRKRLRGKLRWISIDNGKYVSGLGEDWTNEGYITIAGNASHAFDDLYSLTVIFPESHWPVCERVLVTVGDALHAFTACLSPRDATSLLRATQMGGPPTEATAALGARLPRVRFCMYGGLQHAAQPEILGWLNYWSAETCEFVGFPGEAHDEPLLRHSYRTPGGAWLVKLTEEPLDLRRPDHVDAIAGAYARYPRVGVR